MQNVSYVDNIVRSTFKVIQRIQNHTMSATYETE